MTQPFGAKLLALYTGSVLTKLIDIGYEVGLFEASRAGPATSAQLAVGGEINIRPICVVPGSFKHQLVARPSNFALGLIRLSLTELDQDQTSPGRDALS